MPLDNIQIMQLSESINGYTFPCVYYDFENNLEVECENIMGVEAAINILLRSNNIIDVKHGLANVLYWGYAQMGIRDTRIRRFMNSVEEEQIRRYQSLVIERGMITLIELNGLHMPEFAGMSFISKVLMFLNPNEYCVLDQQIAKLRNGNHDKALNNLVFGQGETKIRITNHNESVYNTWCNECRAISENYYNFLFRVVDVERGFFNLIQNNQLQTAKEIYNAA